MARIMVIGNAGNGKTTLCLKLGARLDIEVFHVDSLQWQPGWRPTPAEESARMHDNLILRERWIVGGFGRLICDGVMHALVLDLIVAPDRQGQGIGRTILRRLLERCDASGIRDVQLFCASGKQGFYRKMGFEARPDDAPGMQLARASR
jgi:GNAT superfamily N-acetyltransferase